jgi:hypothetical protein
MDNNINEDDFTADDDSSITFPDFSGKVIWFVHDSQTLLSAMSRILLKQCKTKAVKTFTDPYAAIAAIEQLSPQGKELPDLIVTDYSFSPGLKPGEDYFLRRKEPLEVAQGGRWIAREVRDKRLDIPVLVRTGDMNIRSLMIPGATVVSSADERPFVTMKDVMESGRAR